MFDAWRSSGPSREQTDAVVAVLERELLVPVDSAVADAHLEAMMLEYAVSRPSVEATRRPPRRVPRAVLGSLAVAGALTFTGGLGAAGALPAPAQHWLSRATRVFGIHIPDRPVPASGGSAPKVSTHGPSDAPILSPTPARGASVDLAPTRAAPTIPAGAGSAPRGGAGNGNANGIGNGVANGGGNGTADAGSNAGGSAGGNGQSQAAEHPTPNPAASNADTPNAGGNGKSQAAEHTNSNVATPNAAASNAATPIAGSSANSQTAVHAHSASSGGGRVAKGKAPDKATPTSAT